MAPQNNNPQYWSRVERFQDILQLRFTALFAALPTAALNQISPLHPGRRLLKMAGYAVIRLLGNILRPAPTTQPLQGKIWLYVVSQNNVEALRFLTNQLPGATLVAGQGKQIGRYDAQVSRLSLSRKILYYWQFPGVLWELWRRQGPAALRFIDLIFASIGYYEVYYRTLNMYQPRAVVFANDHNDDARALLLACRALGIPTAYLQHASVSRWFPPLSFDMNMLEGQHALDIYRSCGPIKGQVKLVGMPKIDAFLQQRNHEPSVRRVGIAASLLDPTPELVASVQALVQALPQLSFTFRAHPSEWRDFRSLLSGAAPYLEYSNARTENVLDFLGRHDALIAAETSTHLEATLLNLKSIYFKFGPGYKLSHDYYGFIRHGLISEAVTMKQLIDLLARMANQKPDALYLRAAYYCATLGTPNEGHSQQFVANILKKWLFANKES